MRIDWRVVAQSRVGKPLKVFFEENGVTSYEEAKELLSRFGQPVGPRKEVAEFLPEPRLSFSAVDNPDPAPVSSPVRRTSDILKSKKSRGPKSAAEAAADAITKSKAVKSPQESQKKKRTRKRKS
tara:strand:- start:607 stop:981 length:375 start_codon:yes stop_codon:yes gene_type:complete